MIDDLNLPSRDAMPDAEPKNRRLTLQEYDRWVNEHYRWLHRQGLLERIRRQPTRQPVTEPFRLD